MAKDWQIKKRRPVRRKNIAPLLKDLEEALGIDLAVDGAFLEMADYGPWKMVLVDRVPLAVELMSPDDERVVFLTLRGFLSYPCEKRFVEVDHLIDLDTQCLSSFRDSTYDFVIMNHVIEHIANPIRVIEDAFRILCPSGKVVLGVPDKRFNYDSARDLTSFDHLWREYQDQVTAVEDDHYLDFLRAVHPATLALPEKIKIHLDHARDRREHAHVWDSSSFKKFFVECLNRLEINANCIYEHTGNENGFEYFAMWGKA